MPESCAEPRGLVLTRQLCGRQENGAARPRGTVALPILTAATGAPVTGEGWEGGEGEAGSAGWGGEGEARPLRLVPLAGALGTSKRERWSAGSGCWSLLRGLISKREIYESQRAYSMTCVSLRN